MVIFSGKNVPKKVGNTEKKRREKRWKLKSVEDEVGVRGV